MSDRLAMEQILHDILPDMMALHRVAKSQRTKLKIELYVKRMLEALEAP